MKTWIALLGAWLLVAGVLAAAPLFDEALPVLTLKDGTVLQDAQIKGYANKVVMVRHRGGARTVPYSMFPDEYQATLAARRPAAQTAPAPLKPAPAASTTAAAVNPRTDLRYGCSFVVLSVSDMAIAMEIHNESNQTSAVYPEMFLARTSTGELLPGMQWVGLNNEGSVSVILKHQQLIAPGDVVTLHLMLSPKPHENPVESLHWKD